MIVSTNFGHINVHMFMINCGKLAAENQKALPSGYMQTTLRKSTVQYKNYINIKSTAIN